MNDATERQYLSYDHNGEPIDVTRHTGVTSTSWLAQFLDRNVDLDKMLREQAQGLAQLASDIVANGIMFPIILGITEQGGAVILDGHHRMIVAEQLGMAHVPVVCVPHDEHIDVTECGPIRGKLAEWFRPSDVLEGVPA